MVYSVHFERRSATLPTSVTSPLPVCRGGVQGCQFAERTLGVLDSFLAKESRAQPTSALLTAWLGIEAVEAVSYHR